jgi:RNA recognition motif-containing protein
MATKLYVGNLPYRITEETIEQAFAQAGTVVSVKIITDRETGRSKGFSFVEMASAADAQAAIAMWHQQELEGRPLIVNEARPLEERPPRTGGFQPRREGGFQPRSNNY